MAVPLSAQDVDREPVQVMLERFEETGSWRGLLDILVPCESQYPESDELIEGLVTREWVSDRAVTLTAIFGSFNYGGCPDPRIDGWLETGLRSSLDNGRYRSFFRAIERRGAPETDLLWMDLTTDDSLPADVRRMAFARIYTAMAPGERVEFLFENLGRDDLPSMYIAYETAWLSSRHPDELLSRLDGATLATLPMLGVRSIILTLGTLASGGNRASASTSATSEALLREALPLSDGYRLETIEGALRRCCTNE